MAGLGGGAGCAPSPPPIAPSLALLPSLRPHPRLLLSLLCSALCSSLPVLSLLRAASLLVLCVSALPSCVLSQEELTCTNGRLFVSDSVHPRVFVYDLDSTPPSQVGEFNTAAPAMALYSTQTASARVIGIAAGNSSAQGRAQIFRSGLSTENHGEHSDVVKASPAQYTFELSGWKPAHFTASAGFISLFYDGVWVAGGGEGAQPSSAQFVPESAFTEDSLTVTPAVTTVNIAGGAHHGMAYALDTDAFLVSQPSAQRAAFQGSARTHEAHTRKERKEGGMRSSVSASTVSAVLCLLASPHIFSSVLCLF